MNNLERIIKDLNTTIGEKQAKKRKNRKSTRVEGTNPRAKGTNPRAKSKEPKDVLIEKNSVILVDEYDEFDWFKLELQDPNYFDVEDGKEFLRSN